MNKYYIYTTCGTSTLTNPAREDPKLYDMLISNSNAETEQDIKADIKEKIEEHFNNQITIWQEYSENNARKKSAELNSLLSWQKKNAIAPQNCYCYLLHTDTVLGNYAALLVEEWLKNHGYMGVECQKIKSLSTSTLNNFEKGLSSLAEWAFKNVPSIRSDNTKYIFNVAGGFKAVSGFMQILGQFLADETIYLFEGHNEILSMPRLPVQWEGISSISEHFDDYHKISLGILPEHITDLNSLWVRNNEFTPWGQIAWESAKQILYKEKIQNFVCPQVIEGKKFRKSVQKLEQCDARRKIMVNERIDELCKYIINGRTQNLNHLDYKPLKGVKEFTHECDAWADGNAMRLFCNDYGDHIVVELLGDALH